MTPWSHGEPTVPLGPCSCRSEAPGGHLPSLAQNRVHRAAGQGQTSPYSGPMFSRQSNSPAVTSADSSSKQAITSLPTSNYDQSPDC